MARISKAEHPRILQAIDGDGRKVAEVAAEYGCSTANIYALLGKLRRTQQDAAPVAAAAPAEPVEPDEVEAPPAVPNAPDLFAAAAVPADEQPAAQAKPKIKRRGRAEAKPDPALDIAPSPAPAPQPAPATPSAPAPTTVSSATVTNLPRREPAPSRSMGATLAKPGFGLTMRSAEGDESMVPYRSLDDLLSAVKPILRAAARSPDAVWFSIQPVDLATLDSDAA